MYHTGGTVNENVYGRLVLQSIPTKEAEEMVVSYLSRIVKNIPAEKLAQKVKLTPFVLSKNIADKKGERIAQNLRDLGARAEFVPHDSVAPDPKPISETAMGHELESLLLLAEKNKSRQPERTESPSLAKRLITASVVILLVAVLSLLTWQVYHLVTEKFFN